MGVEDRSVDEDDENQNIEERSETGGDRAWTTQGRPDTENDDFFKPHEMESSLAISSPQRTASSLDSDAHEIRALKNEVLHPTNDYSVGGLLDHFDAGFIENQEETLKKEDSKNPSMDASIVHSDSTDFSGALRGDKVEDEKTLSNELLNKVERSKDETLLLPNRDHSE